MCPVYPAFIPDNAGNLCIALILRWPNPIHRGNGRCVVFIDDRADDAQRKSLSEIGTGKAGPGGPFEIFATTYAEPAAVRFGLLLRGNLLLAFIPFIAVPFFARLVSPSSTPLARGA